MNANGKKTRFPVTFFSYYAPQLLTGLLALGIGVNQASAVVIVEEDFAYPDGALAGQNGGSAGAGSSWSGAWAVAPTLGGDGSTITGNALDIVAPTTAPGQFDSREFSTSFDGSTDGPLYFSANFDLNGADTGYAQWVEIATSAGANGTGRLQFGLADGMYSLRVNTGGGGGNDFGTAPQDGTSVFLVGKVDFSASGDDTVTLWVDPTDVEFASEFTTQTRELGWVTPSFITTGNFVIDAGTTGSIDDIKLGTSWGDVGGPGAAATPGDVTGEGNVTIDDYFVIRNNFRSTVTLITEGDINGPNGVRDGVVDFNDFIEWRTEFVAAGNSLAGLDLSLTAVPEPATASLLLITLAMLGIKRRR